MDVQRIAEKARMIRLAALPVAQEMKTGAFRSFFRGRGIECDSVREYQYGDDVRAIDWNVTARTGKTFVKTFSEERDLSVFIILDASNSMMLGTTVKSKFEYAVEAAALLAFAAEQLPCPVGGIVFNSGIGSFVKPAEGFDTVVALLSVFETYNVGMGDPGSALTETIAGCIPALPSASMVVIFSDFRVSGFKKELERLAFYHKVVAARITDPSDKRMPGSGILRFRDPETKTEILCRPDSHSFQSAWEKEYAENISLWRSICIRCGAVPVELSVTSDAASSLAAFFSARPPGV